MEQSVLSVKQIYSSRASKRDFTEANSLFLNNVYSVNTLDYTKNYVESNYIVRIDGYGDFGFGIYCGEKKLIDKELFKNVFYNNSVHTVRNGVWKQKFKEEIISGKLMKYENIYQVLNSVHAYIALYDAKTLEELDSDTTIQDEYVNLIDWKKMFLDKILNFGDFDKLSNFEILKADGNFYTLYFESEDKLYMCKMCTS
jgi:hypothetical protein